MIGHKQLIELTRDTKKTLYVVAGLYVGVGFVLAIVSAVTGHLLGAFLGFVIISGALAVTALLRAMLRIGLRVSEMSESLSELHEELRRLERMESPAKISTSTEPELRSSPPLAVTAVDDAFPRIAPDRDHEVHHASDAEGHGEFANTVIPKPTLSMAAATPFSDGCSAAMTIVSNNLLRQWKLAHRDQDLAAARRIYPPLIDALDPADADQVHAEMRRLTDQTEQSLRERFQSLAKERDVEGMLLVGDQICELMPDRPVAREFERMKPRLLEASNKPFTPGRHARPQ